MKKIFAIVVIISVALVSCKKSSTSGIGNSAIQATIGNTTTSFDVLAYAYPSQQANYWDNTDTAYSIEIFAYNSASSQPYLDINLTSNHPITAGTVFSDTAANIDYYDNPPYPSSNLSIDYSHDNDNAGSYLDYGTAGVLSSPTTLTITAISATSISGTFQGALYSDSDSTGFKQTVTNGKFTAPITAINPQD